MNESASESERVVILLVHGVGPFDARRQEGEARAVISQAIPHAAVEVESFDWRAEVGGAIRRTRLDPAALGGLGASWHAITLDRLLPELQSPRARRRAAVVITLYHFAMTFLPVLLLGFWLAGNLKPSKPKPAAGKNQSILEIERSQRQFKRLSEARREGRPIPPFLLDGRLREIPDLPAPRPWPTVCRGALIVTALLFAAVVALQLPRRGGSLAGRLAGLAVPWIWSAMSSLLILPYLLVQASRGSLVKNQGWILGPVLGGIVGWIAFLQTDRLQARLLVAALCIVPIGAFFGPRLVRWATGRSLRLLQTPVGLALMLISDVVRYLGDARYRHELQDQLSERLRKLLDAQPRDLVLAAHSLGSVIAVDTLRRRGQVVPPQTRVTLLTMGSPLKRTFHRFFSNRYPDPLELRDELNANIGPLRWINVHRPFDPVGTDLLGSLPADRVAGKVRWSWPFLLFFPAHTDYWGDAVVLDQALQGIRALPFSTRTPRAAVKDAPVTDPPPGRANDARGMASESLALASGIATGLWVYRATFADSRDLTGLFIPLVILFAGILYMYVFSPYFGIAIGYVPDRRPELPGTLIEIRPAAPADSPEPRGDGREHHLSDFPPWL